MGATRDRAFPHAVECDPIDHHDHSTRVFEVIRVVLGLQKRIYLGGHGTDLLHGVPGRDELDRVGQREEDPLAGPDTQLEQRVADPVAECGQLGVGAAAGRAGQRCASAATVARRSGPGTPWPGSGRGPSPRRSRRPRGLDLRANQVDEEARRALPASRRPRRLMPRPGHRNTRGPCPWRGSRSGPAAIAAGMSSSYAGSRRMISASTRSGCGARTSDVS